MAYTLSEGSLLTICQGGTYESPILQVIGENLSKTFLKFSHGIYMQVLSFKRIAGSSTDRYRLLISDGLYSNSYAMLATQQNHMVFLFYTVSSRILFVIIAFSLNLDPQERIIRVCNCEGEAPLV